MSGKRSPNCPAHDLEEAIEKVRAIYHSEGRNSFSGDRAVSRMGYNGLNGASRRALGAIRAFGLIEGRGSQLRVSDDAVLIIADAVADDQRERQGALLRSLCHNRVFSDLFQRLGAQASLAQASAFLQKKYQFKPAAADHAAQVFLRSSALLALNGAAPASSSSDHGEPVSFGEFGTGLRPSNAAHQVSHRGSGNAGMENHTSHSASGPAGMTASERAEKTASKDLPTVETGYCQDNFTLKAGAASLRWPTSISREEFEDLTDWLILELRKISRLVDGEVDVLVVRREKPDRSEFG